MEQLVGNSLDRYQIVALLGEGNTGQVFQAHDVKFLRDVAIKVIHPLVAQQPGFEPRFSQAVRTAIGLRHPGLVKVFDFGEARSLFYVVMEYIPGGTLREALHSLRADRQWIALSEAVRLVRQICLALDYTRRQGAPHRDAGPGQIALKPQPGDDLPYQAVLTDLGLAELRAGGGALPDGISPDALAYFSPEQVKGETLDHRSGIYSAGILLYELALARPPFRIATVADAIRCHTAETPTAPRSIRADLPASLERVILTAIEKDPARRFADAGEMAEALADVLPAAAEVDARPDTRAWAVSLATRLPQFETPGPTRRPEAPQPHTPQSVEVDVSRQRIQLVEKGRVTRSIPMKAGGLRIGRAADNDVVIDQITVSEHHARVEFDGTEYKVVDLNSSSGTYLGGAKLPPGMLEVWPPDKPLRIGRAWLRAERPAQSRLAEGAFVRADGSAIDPSRIRYSADEGRVGVFVEEAQLTVVPGNRATLPLIIFNQGLDDDVFTVSVKGVPDIWMDEALPAIPLAPGAQQEVKLIIRPPRSAQSRAGRRPLTIRVTSQGKPDEVVEVRVSLMIVVYSEFSSDLRPQRIRAGETASVVVHNHGNTPETFRLACVDPGGVLAFDPGEVLLTAAEGQGAAAEFKARLSRPRLFGGARAHGFSARIVSQSGQAQVQAGEVISKGLFPAWTIPVALVVLFALAALAALIPRGTPSTAPTAPVIGKTFSNVAGVNSTLIFTLTNPNTAITLTGVAFTDSLPTMPAAMIVANSPNASFSAGCGSPSFAPGPGSGIIAFSNGTLVGGGTCTAAVDVIASAGGTYNNTTSPVTSNEAGAGNAASATLTTGAVAPPSIAKSFSQTSLPAGGVTRLTFTIVNPNLAIALTGVAFTDTFPATPGAMVVANPPNPSLSAGCGQPVFAPAAGSGFVAFSSGVIPGGQTCTVAVDVTVGTGGTYTNVTSAVVSIEGGAGNTAIGVLTVSAIAPPSMTKVFSPSSIPAGAKSTLTFTITNPNLALSLTGVAFNDAFPANMVVANPPNPSLSAGCGQPGFSPVAGSGSVAFSNGTIAGGGVCVASVDVSAPPGGTYANASGAVTSANGGTGNTATAALTVGAVAPPSLTKSFAPGTVTAGMKSTLTFTITNPNAAAALTGVGFSDTFPTTPGALQVASPSNANAIGCGSPVFSPAVGSGSVTFSNGTIAGGGVCIVTVDVTASIGGAYTNTSSAVTSANGGTGNPATAIWTVLQPPKSVTIEGPSTGALNTNTAFTATVMNLDATTPITYVWEATGQSQPITRTGATLSDTVVLSWTLTGEQFITVTASNAAGVMSNTHSVMIAFAGAPAFANDDNNFGYRKSVSECPTNKRITPAATGQLFIRSSVPRQTCPVSPGTGPENR